MKTHTKIYIVGDSKVMQSRLYYDFMYTSYSTGNAI